MPELLARFVARLADPVGVQQQQIARLELHRGLAVRSPGDQAQRQVQDFLAERSGVVEQGPLAGGARDTTAAADGPALVNSNSPDSE